MLSRTTRLSKTLALAGILLAASPARADDAAALVACDKGWQHCKVDLDERQKALDKANQATAEQHAAAQRALAHEAEVVAGVRGRATWSYGLGVGGAALVAISVALLLDDRLQAGAVAGGAGLLALAGGVAVARW